MKSALFTAAVVAPLAASASASACSFKNLVTFGDSYTDEGRLDYMAINGEYPAPGEAVPPVNQTASGGHSWPHFVSEATGAKRYNYAIGGASCSSEIVERGFDFFALPFPGVLEDEVPTFEAELEMDGLFPDRTAENTVYSLWVGGNDLSLGGFFDDSNADGTTLTSVAECMWEVLDAVYRTGGRRFVLFTQIALQHTPVYNTPELGGRESSLFFPDKPDFNATQYHLKLDQYVTSISTMTKYGAPFQLLVEDRWPGASVSVFDAERLLTDMYRAPEDYFEAPANGTGLYSICTPGDPFPDCPTADEPLDSFLWYDDTHASPRARKLNVVRAKSLTTVN